jgi:hypothetical protein
MAEANRAERHAWAERCAAAARSSEAHKYLGFQVIKAEPCPGLLAACTNCAYALMRADGRRPGADME